MLIFDRTLADCIRAHELEDKIKNAEATEEDMEEWLAGHRGCYNASDMARVTFAAMEVREAFSQMGYNVPYISDDENRPGYTELMLTSQIQALYDMVRVVRDIIPLADLAPDVPHNIQGFSVTEANALEKIIYVVEKLRLNSIDNMWVCGEPYCGE